MPKAQACEVPPFSALGDSLRTADFYDCYTVDLPPDGRSPLEIYLGLVSQTPRWVDALMSLRNKVVAKSGSRPQVC